MDIFDGILFAQARELALKPRVAELTASGKQPVIAAILFKEDAGSQLYTRLKREAAERVGIEYQIYTFSLLDPRAQIVSQIQALNADSRITGIIIQKPAKKRVLEVLAGQVLAEDLAAYFQSWWQELVSQLDSAKDVDGLHPDTLAAIEAGNWRTRHKVLPATASAVLTILAEIFSAPELQEQKIVILGKSDIFGKPLFYELRNQGCDVEMMGSKELAARVAAGQALKDKTVVISATGQKHLITGELLGEGVALIDVGEPKPDIDLASVQEKAWFVTPVPGGVGPVTVVSLLENSLVLVEPHS
jgi:methylenetetrahydrofolate dehydrogenase (NADP+)/methenyltetrahydrofolate cyclohydrolase